MVKLDKESIESLGWFRVSNNYPEYEFKKLAKVSTKPEWDVIYYLYWDSELDRVTIVNNEDDVFFNGYLKTKEELEVLMRQVDIE